jgi:hypothetical protein
LSSVVKSYESIQNSFRFIATAFSLLASDVDAVKRFLFVADAAECLFVAFFADFELCRLIVRARILNTRYPKGAKAPVI